MKRGKQKISILLAVSLILSMFTGWNGTMVQAKKKKEKVKVTSVKITNVDKKIRIQKKKAYRLKTEVKVKPNKAKYKKVKFTSSDRKVVVVNSHGLMKGKKVGKAKITAVSRENKNKKAKITVEVTNDILVKTIKLDRSKIEVDEFNEEDIPLQVTKILPKNAKNKDINWSTSNAKVADVDDDGVVSTGDVGTAVITAEADDQGGAKATCTVVVTPNKDDDDDEPDVTEEPVSTPAPIQGPTAAPAQEPTTAPTGEPEPTEAPTQKPTVSPTQKPTEAPTQKPTASPTQKPTEAPTQKPTEAPTQKPTASPTQKPTEAPTQKPTASPTQKPTEAPTQEPTEAPTQEPTTAPTKSYYFTDICVTETADVGGVCSNTNVTVRPVKDESDEACTEIRYTQTYQYVFLELPEGVDLSQYESIRIKANVPEQLCIRAFSEDLDLGTESWWTQYSLCDSYPFYGGTKGGEQEAAIDVDTTDGKQAKYIALVSNKAPVDGYEKHNYLIYSITLVPKKSDAEKIVIRSTENTTQKPTEPSEIPNTPAQPMENDTVYITEDNEMAWVKKGEFGSQIYDPESGFMTFYTDPENEEKEGDVYNNGVGWYLSSTHEAVDISKYKYVEVTVSGDYWNVKIMTWSGGQSADSFWDKKDSWGDMWLENPIKNADGTVTMRYAVQDIFANTQRANAIGITLKACEDDNDKVYESKDINVYSIRFTNPSAAPTQPPITPGVETPTRETVYDFTDICMVETSTVGDICSNPNVNVRAAEDEYGQTRTEIHYTGTNQYVFLELPEGVDLSQYESIQIKANVPEQLCMRVFSEDLDRTAENWWTEYSLCEIYHDSGIDWQTFKLDNVNSKPAKYIALVSNKAPADGYKTANYFIYYIELVSKSDDKDTIVINSARR